ncbi:hypothetical protein C8J56DRAFT_1037313 [Mycena floridula]|nr:hypothetical protein C8J56DRAFT_1037313 [Mycena floridula]
MPVMPVSICIVAEAHCSFSGISHCGLINDLQVPIPDDNYECWVVVSGLNPGLYTSHKAFLSEGLGFAAGVYKYFSGPGTKAWAQTFLKEQNNTGKVIRMARTISPTLHDESL